MKLGYLSAFVYVLITTVSALFIESRLANIGDTLTVLFLAVFITSIFFNLIGIKIIRKAYKNVFSDIYAYLLFCLFVSLVWISSVYGVQYSNAVVFNINFFMASTACAYFVQYRNGKSKTDLILLIISLALIFMTYCGNSRLWVGIVIGVLSGSFAYLYKRASFAYAKKHAASALEIMMTRFIPIIVCLSFKIDFHHTLAVFNNFQTEVLFFALISFIIPTYLGQHATNHIGAEQSSIISALIFPLCWLGDFILHYGSHNKVDFNDLLIALLSFGVVVYPYLLKIYQIKFKR